MRDGRTGTSAGCGVKALYAVFLTNLRINLKTGMRFGYIPEHRVVPDRVHGCNTGDVPKLLEARLPPPHPIFELDDEADLGT